MKHTFLIAAAALILAACSTSQPAAEPVVDPVTDPTIAGAVVEAVDEGSARAEAGARTGRRIGRVAGVLAAVFGGPESESVEETVDRYRRTRDTAEAAGAVIGATTGAAAGAKRGYILDATFAELHQIANLDVTRPSPYEIEIVLAGEPAGETLAAVGAVLAGAVERGIYIDVYGAASAEITESLIGHGVPAATITANQGEEPDGATVILVR